MIDVTDPDAVDAVEEEIMAGVSVEYKPIGGGEMRLRAFYDDEMLASGEYAEVFSGSHRGRTNRGEFINNVKDSVEGLSGLDADEIGSALRRWFEDLAEIAEEEELAFQPDHVRQIIEGTQQPVEIHGGEETTWIVTLSYAGRTTDLEFTAGDMTGGGAPALEEKLANYFYELIEIEPEDWKTIRDWWHDHSEVVTVVDETGRDAVADRFINRVADAVRPLAELEQMPNDPAGAWYDADNDAGYAPAGDGPVLWVQSRFFTDKLEAIGKQIEYKGQLTKDLIAEGALYDTSVRRTWDGVFDRRTRLFPFDPDELGIKEIDVAPPAGDNTDEVDP